MNDMITPEQRLSIDYDRPMPKWMEYGLGIVVGIMTAYAVWLMTGM